MKLNQNKLSLLAAFLTFTLSACNDKPAIIVSTGTPDVLPLVNELPPVKPAPTTAATPVAAKPSPAPSTAPVSDAKVALVYAGTGVCEEDCAAAAAESARLAGLTPKLVVGNSLSDDATPAQVQAFYKNAVVWIEPGGYARNSWQGMTKKMQTTLKEFVVSGGGYVGFCAGAFMATTQIGSTGAAGLGIFPGKTYPFNGTTTVTINWQGTSQKIYWEGGPYFYDLDSTVEVVGLYKDNSVAAARTQYGAGRVFLSGPHPEAPDWWTSGSSSSIRGRQQPLAAEMIKWAARLP